MTRSTGRRRSGVASRRDYHHDEGCGHAQAGSTTLMNKIGLQRAQTGLSGQPGRAETTLSYGADKLCLSITNSGDGSLPDFSYGNYDAIGNGSCRRHGDSYTCT